MSHQNYSYWQQHKLATRVYYHIKILDAEQAGPAPLTRLNTKVTDQCSGRPTTY